MLNVRLWKPELAFTVKGYRMKADALNSRISNSTSVSMNGA